jgi:hypothetical protein
MFGAGHLNRQFLLAHEITSLEVVVLFLHPKNFVVDLGRIELPTCAFFTGTALPL